MDAVHRYWIDDTHDYRRDAQLRAHFVRNSLTSGLWGASRTNASVKFAGEKKHRISSIDGSMMLDAAIRNHLRRVGTSLSNAFIAQ